MKWSVYNQSLVRRGEIRVGFDVINNWDRELKQMNKDKVGEPFQYPNAFLLLLRYAKGKVSSIPYYTTINRMINRLDIKIKDDCSSSSSKEPKNNYIIIAIYSICIKVTNRSQWIKDKWNIRKWYLKIHVAVVDIKNKKILLLKVTDEHVHDSKVLPNS